MKPERLKTDFQDEPNGSGHMFWFKLVRLIVHCLVVLILTGVVAYRLWRADLSGVRLDTFDFSQLLSLLLAVFSIGLSAAFYFKATDTSNKFYDRTYFFMKDLFEVLGRIEERFGERLQNIHEDTVGMRRDLMQSGNQKQPSVATTAAVAPPPDVQTSNAKEKTGE